jgi:hypothetical protein
MTEKIKISNMNTQINQSVVSSVVIVAEVGREDKL